MKATAINDALVAIVTALDSALSYPVFDGPPSKKPGNSVTGYLVVGAEDIDDQENPTRSASMSAQITGLGQVCRSEDFTIECVAVGKAVHGTIATARATATAVLEAASQSLPKSPGGAYGAQVADVNEVRAHNVAGGSIVQIHFTISASARLT